jgi:hypothetical protein
VSTGLADSIYKAFLFITFEPRGSKKRGSAVGIEYIGKKHLDWSKLQDHGMARTRYKAIQSRFESTCSICQGKIEAGTPIWYDKLDRTAMHLDCRPQVGV